MGLSAERADHVRLVVVPKTVFEVNSTVEIQVDETFCREVLSGRILSVDADTITVGLDAVKGTPVSLLRGVRVHLSVSRLLSRYSFDTTVTGVKSNPKPILLLARPADEAGAYQRAHVRLDVVIDGVRLVVPNGKQTWAGWGTIVNLSAGGALLRTSTVMPANARLWLEFTLPDGEGPIYVECLALRCMARPGLKSVSYRTAVRFVGISEVDQDRITRFIFRRESEMRGKGLR